jgi:ABC-type sugar transport system ATPase subunit
MVFQNYALYPQMTARQNLAFGLQQRKTPQDEISRRVSEVAAPRGLEASLA